MSAVATKERTNRGSIGQSGAYCNTIRKMTITIDWKNMNTAEVPIDARARISRGNATFLTMPARSTITPVAVETPVWKKFQNKSPENR